MENIWPPKHLHICFYQHYSQQSKVEITRVHQLNWQTKVAYVHTREYYLAIKRMKYWHKLQHGQALKTLWEVMSVRPKVILRHPWTYNMPSTTPHTRREKGSKPPGADPLAECQKKKRLNTCCSKCDPKTRSTATQKFVRNLSLLDSKAQHSPAL